jgi:hypothetical protein
MSLTEQIADLVEHLYEPEQLLILEIIRRFLPDDTVATPDDLQAIALANTEYANGETVNHHDIDWD